MSKKIIICILIMLVLLVGCENSFDSCIYECKTNLRECFDDSSSFINLGFLNRTCNTEDNKFCFEECKPIMNIN